MNTADKIIHWLPRVICILAILLVSMFAFDVFSPDLTIWQQILALLIHLIPSFILIAILIVAWKWEKIGGIILTVTGVILFVLVFIINYRRNNFSLTQSLINVSILCLPFIIAGVLFIISHNRKHKKIITELTGD
jgi:prolipoprotein diacylglyceryltransferase